MLRDNEALIRAGGAIVFLRPRSKRPFEDNWTDLPRLTWEEANARYPAKSNIGLRLGEPSKGARGYIYGLDLDIRDETAASEALDKFETVCGAIRDFDTVRSGSGGSSRHAYFVSDVAFRTRKLAHASYKVTGRDGKQHWAWEIDLGGTGRQFVLPPSIHPITRQPYVWETNVNWEDLLFIPGDVVQSWIPDEPLRSRDAEDADIDELMTWYRNQPTRFTIGEIERILDTLSKYPLTFDKYVTDREGWLNVGFALHHQFEGSEEGYELWCEFSGADEGKFDEEDQWRVWRSMGKRGARVPLTMKTLYLESKRAHLGEEYGLHRSDDEEPTRDLPDDFGVRDRVNSEREERQPERPERQPDREESKPGDQTDEERWQISLENIEIADKRAQRREEDRWTNELDLNDQDQIKVTPTNLALIVANDDRLRGVIGFNEFTGEIVQLQRFGLTTAAMFEQKPVDPVNGDLWTDAHDVNLRMFFATKRQGRHGGYGMKVPVGLLDDAVLAAAQKNRFHPVRAYLKDLLWDGVRRMENVFVRYLGAPDRPYFREVARITFLAAIARVMEPGHKFDFAVILEGLEGKRKSTFIETMACGWFGELSGDFHDRKGMVEKMQGKWIVELPELSGMQRSAVTEVKAFMSTKEDYVRLAYARRAGKFPRQCIFIGSTNDREYLASETGNRRFFPLPCSVAQIDTAALAREIDMVWAEAFVTYRQMRRERPYGDLPLYLTNESAADEAFRFQKERKTASPVEIMTGEIEEWLNTPGTRAQISGDHADKFEDSGELYVRTHTCIAQIWQELLGNTNRMIDATSTKMISHALHSIVGFQPGKRVVGRYGRQRVIERARANDHEILHGLMRYDRSGLAPSP